MVTMEIIELLTEKSIKFKLTLNESHFTEVYISSELKFSYIIMYVSCLNLSPKNFLAKNGNQNNFENISKNIDCGGVVDCHSISIF